MNHATDLHLPRMIVQNLRNRPFRSLATVFACAIIASTFFASQFLMGAAQASLDAGTSRMGADVLVAPAEYAHAGQTVLLTGEPTTFFLDPSAPATIAAIPGVARASPQIYLATLHASCCAAPVQMIAVDPATDFTVSTWVREHPGIALGKDDMIIGSAVVQDIGKNLQFYGHDFYVVGQLERTGMGVDNSVFIRADDARVMAAGSGTKAVKPLVIPDGAVSLVLVRVDPGVDPAGVARAIEERVPGSRTILPDGLLSAVSGQLGTVTRLLYGSAIAVALVTVPLLGLLAAMVAHERRREVSILRALGATRRFVAGLLLAETVVLAVLGGIAGIGGAMMVLVMFSDLIAQTLQVPLLLPSPLLLLARGGDALLLLVAIAGASSLYPVWRAVRAEPYGTMRGGES